MIHRFLAAIAWLGGLAVLMASCSGEQGARRADGLEPTSLPVAIRDDYQVFAQRCSKCHSLSRPLGAGVDSDQAWVNYVERMRRQPESGIAPDDTAPILRFLHYLVLRERAAKAAPEPTIEPASPDAAAPAPNGAPR